MFHTFLRRCQIVWLQIIQWLGQSDFALWPVARPLVKSNFFLFVHPSVVVMLKRGHVLSL